MTIIKITDEDIRQLNAAQNNIRVAQANLEKIICELETKYDFIIQRDNLILDKRIVEKGEDDK